MVDRRPCRAAEIRFGYTADGGPPFPVRVTPAIPFDQEQVGVEVEGGAGSPGPFPMKRHGWPLTRDRRLYTSAIFSRCTGSRASALFASLPNTESQLGHCAPSPGCVRWSRPSGLHPSSSFILFAKGLSCPQATDRLLARIDADGDAGAYATKGRT